jgi:glycerate dehydrogenase
MPTMKIVFLDRDTIGPGITIRRPAFDHEWIEYGKTGPDEVIGRLNGAQVAITNKVRIRRDAVAGLPDLRLIAVAATGVDVIDLEACRERQIVVSNVRGYATNTVPEHTFALILSLMRNLPQYRAEVLDQRWQREGQFCFFNRPIRDLAGATLGVIGCGSIGRSVGQVGLAFGMRVLFHDDYVETAPDGAELVSLEALLRRSDVVTCHCPLTPETKGLIGREQLRLMKPEAFIVNTARGGIIDETALADALEAGTIAGAAIDVFEREPPDAEHRLMQLADRHDVIITPHIAWAGVGAMQALCDQVTDIIEAWQRGAPINRVA